MSEGQLCRPVPLSPVPPAWPNAGRNPTSWAGTGSWQGCRLGLRPPGRCWGQGRAWGLALVSGRGVCCVQARPRGLGWDPLCPLCEFRRVRDVRPCKHAPAVSREETKPRLDPRPPSALGPGGQPALGHLAPWLRGAPRCLSCICCLSPRSRRKRAEPGVWHRAAAAPGLSGVPFFCCDGSSQAAALGSGRFLSLRTPRDRSHGGSPASPRAQRIAPLPSARRGLEPPGAQSRAVGALGHCHPILCTKGHVSLCFFSLTF